MVIKKKFLHKKSYNIAETRTTTECDISKISKGVNYHKGGSISQKNIECVQSMEIFDFIFPYDQTSPGLESRGRISSFAWRECNAIMGCRKYIISLPNESIT